MDIVDDLKSPAALDSEGLSLLRKREDWRWEKKRFPDTIPTNWNITEERFPGFQISHITGR
jgi:hypothetical protein